MGGPDGQPRTLYMSAPSTEFERLAPVFGGMLGDLREQIHAWDIAGRKLDKPLLILIDEAGQLELRWFPEEVSTIAGLGGFFVTGWQSKSQITARYGPLADAVLSGHRSKIIFNGTDDPVHPRIRHPHRRDRPRQPARHLYRRHAAAPSANTRNAKTSSPPTSSARCAAPTPCCSTARCRRSICDSSDGGRTRNSGPSSRTAPDGKAASTRQSDGTCPVADRPTSEVAPVIDEAQVQAQIAAFPARKFQLPIAVVLAAAASRTPRRRRSHRVRVPSTSACRRRRQSRRHEVPINRNRVAGTCERCRRRVAVGAGINLTYGQRVVICCHPTCEPQPASARKRQNPGGARSEQPDRGCQSPSYRFRLGRGSAFGGDDMTDADRLEGLVSPARFAVFVHACCGGDRERAVALYHWDAELSGALHVDLGYVEIALRNRMHNALSEHHSRLRRRPAGTEWFDGPSWVRHHWFDRAGQTAIDDACRIARHWPPHASRPDAVVAALGFGFWRYLVTARYEQSFWVPILDHAFAAVPGRTAARSPLNARLPATGTRPTPKPCRPPRTGLPTHRGGPPRGTSGSAIRSTSRSRWLSRSPVGSARSMSARPAAGSSAAGLLRNRPS